MQHSFTNNIKSILETHFGNKSERIFERSTLIQYLNLKTKSASHGAKARSSFANLYAVYVLVEDYIQNNFIETGNYATYEGALYNKLFQRQRELPFGNKLQNHALNNRMNAEFQKFFQTSEFIPILRNLENNRYWINENLLKIEVDKEVLNISKAIIEIIDAYGRAKRDAFEQFIQTCIALRKIENDNTEGVEKFISGLLAPNVDARLFEIVSYAILKYFYQDQMIYWGFDLEKLQKEHLKLYKTGRTNANDGGIDFVMKPLGRFFQVTETLDFKKYFLDIDKIEKYPITFIVKTDTSESEILEKLRDNAMKSYGVVAIVEKYMNCIEEIINVQKLQEHFNFAVQKGNLTLILNEIIIQSKVEYNFEDDDTDTEGVV